jgi:disulfide bond formation protein DsbB
MTRDRLLLLALLGSAGMLLGAFGFQYIGGLHPCELCILQRWPHAIAVFLALAALILRGRTLPWLGALTMAVSAGLGFYHSGVQMKWWAGPTACTSSLNMDGLNSKQLLNQLMQAPIVRCDEIGWTFLNLSMPAWNAIISAVLVLIWIGAAMRKG